MESFHEYPRSTVTGSLYRLFNSYGLVERDSFNLYSLTEIGWRYFDLLFSEPEAPGISPGAGTTTTTLLEGPKAPAAAQKQPDHARSRPVETHPSYRSATDQLHFSYTSATEVLQIEDPTPVLEQNRQRIIHEVDKGGSSRVGSDSSGSTIPSGAPPRRFFTPLNEGEKRSFAEAIQDWIVEASPSTAEIEIVVGLKNYLLTNNKSVSKIVESEEQAARLFDLSLEEFRAACNKLHARRQAYFGTFSGQSKVGFLLEWTDLLRHGIWRK